MSQNNKIYDISPPKAPKTAGFMKIISQEKEPAKAGFPFPRKTTLFLAAGGVVLMAVLAWGLIKPKAEIIIWPKMESMRFTVAAAVHQDGKAADDIPGEIFDVKDSVSGSFLSSGTGTNTSKARGTIRIYNSYSAKDQQLIPNTRFVSSDGKLFRTSERVNVPGLRYEGGKSIPGTVDVLVTADQPGEEYNIDAAVFSLPGLVGTAAYTSIYAKSFNSMSGGIKKEFSKITQEDIDRAEYELAQKAMEESMVSLEKTLSSDDYVILKEAMDQKITQFSASAEPGQEGSEFSAQAQSEVTAMVFKKSAVRDFAEEYLLHRLPAGDALQKNSILVEYIIEDGAADSSKIRLNLTIVANKYSAIDSHGLKEAVKNKDSQAIAEILKTYPQIKRARVDLWPFWEKESPDSAEMIDIKLKLD